MKYAIDDFGYYGSYGGAYIPEMLYNNIEQLKTCYSKYKKDPDFLRQFSKLLSDYVGRPSPLYYAKRLSEHYNTNVFLKREDLNHTGAHKINNTIGQALLAQKMGKKHIIAETGAGQHGVATATVCALMGFRCTVFMGALDIERQRPNVERMELLGATVVSVSSGNKTLKDATNEAIRFWINHAAETYYIIGSVVGPDPYPDMVSFFQSIISREIKEQIHTQTGQKLPDAVIACVGGGSNAAGAFYEFLDYSSVKLIGVEAAGLGIDTTETAATIATGSPGIIHGCKTLLMQTEDGQIIEPYSISAGLDYPGIGPLHAYLSETARASYLSATDDDALKAGYKLMKMEGIIPALESAHALSVLEKIAFSKNENIIICLSGRGDKDLSTYIKYSKTIR